jgi:hypothetical protein
VGFRFGHERLPLQQISEIKHLHVHINFSMVVIRSVHKSHSQDVYSVYV